MENYRLEITKVDNGYIVRLNNDNPCSKVFVSFSKMIEFISEFFKEQNDLG